jgi:copper chaperone CopZ
MSTVVMNVPDISCAHCERAITEALQPVEGVRDVGVDIPGRTVTVAYDADAVSVELLHEVLAEADYPVAAPG